MNLKYKIHRGSNQIGGNILEIRTQTTRVLFDVGLSLNEEDNINHPKIRGLFNQKSKDKPIDAVFISHYHSDHLGLVYDIDKNIPVYIGESSYKIIQASNNYLDRPDFIVKDYLAHKKTFTIGDIKITSYLCDHSAYDSYMLLAEFNGEKILYTGDFRSNGRKNYNILTKELPKNVDILICEGTTLSRPNYIAETEKELEKKVCDIISTHDGPIFVLQSSMNIDRLVTMYRAAKRNNRIFLEDLYLAEITNSIGKRIPNPTEFNDVFVFITRSLQENSKRYQLFKKYGEKRISRDKVTNSKYVMCIRSSMGKYLQSINNKKEIKNGVLIYSLWSGYLQDVEMGKFVKICEDLGIEIIHTHTSGHADAKTLKEFIDEIRPKEVIPIHTENIEWFKNLNFK